VQHGFPLFWSLLPSPEPPFLQQNNKEALACRDFVTSSIIDLLRANAIMKWHTQPKRVFPSNVVTRSNGKQRLILDLRHVNQFLIPSFRMDSLNLLTDLDDLDDLMFSLDLASGYHQVDMDPRYYMYLGFQWEDELYVFRVLPFGFASAPWCFTKIMRTMRTISLYLRFRGVRLINYLNDFRFLVSDSQSTAHRQLVLDTFRSAGLSINEFKSHLQFTRLLTHLGFVIDLDSGSFEVSQERWESLQQPITEALSKQKVLVHLLSQIAGHLSSVILAIGHVALIKSGQCHSYLQQYSLQFYVAISDSLRDELTYWSHLSRTHFCKKIWPPPFTSDISIWCDAGATSRGATMENQKLQAQGFFLPELWHGTSSSTLREMWGLLNSLESFLDIIRHKSVH